MFSRIGFSLNQFGNEDISIIDTIRDPLGSELSLVSKSSVSQPTFIHVCNAYNVYLIFKPN